MNHTNYTTKGKKNKYLTEQDRYQIEALKKQVFQIQRLQSRLGKQIARFAVK